MALKKSNRILIVVTVVIWGAVVYNILGRYLKKTTTVVTAEMLTTPNKSVISTKRDTFNLVFPSKDPFLKTIKKPKAKMLNKRKKASVPVKKVKITEPWVWPEIRYLGFVKSKENSSKLGLVRISGKIHRVKKGQVVEGLKIIEVSKGNLVIKGGGEQKSIKRN